MHTTTIIRSRLATIVLTSVAVSLRAVAGQAPAPPSTLPANITRQLAESLGQARRHPRSVWRDTTPLNADGTVTGYIEIGRGDRRKFEFRIGANALAIDRVMPRTIGGYPVNYGFVPQTISYDGDPFDFLVLGPSIPSGTIVTGTIVGLMQMEDEKGLDSKVVVSRVRNGRPIHTLTDADKQRIGGFFRRYKAHEPGKFSKVPGWGSAADGLAYVRMTHTFFERCRERAGAECRVSMAEESR